MKSGFDDFVGKPFKASEIFSKISHHLDFQYENKVAEVDKVSPDATIYSAIDEHILIQLEELLKIKNITAIKELGFKLSHEAHTQSVGVKIIELISKFDFMGLESFLEELK